MKNDPAQELFDSIDNAITALEAKIQDPATEQTIREWLAALPKFHHYSWSNVFWLMAQACSRKTTISQVASFKKWTALYGANGKKVSVIKGEKGYKIIFPMKFPRYQLDANGNALLNDRGERIPMLDSSGKSIESIYFSVGYVFDISQTNAREIGAIKDLDCYGDFVDIDADLVHTIATRITKTYDIPVYFESHPASDAGGWYSLTYKKIVINTARSSENHLQLGTLFHELGHALMHGKDPQNYSRSLREGQAEAFAYAASLPFGIVRKSELYIATWIRDEVPLVEVMQDLSDHIKNAYSKLKIFELVEQHQQANAAEMGAEL